MKRQIYWILPGLCAMLLGAVMLGGCRKETANSKIPYISWIGMSKDRVQSGNVRDTVLLVFALRDGDGDLGHDDEYDLFLIDSRDTSRAELGFSLPTIPDEIVNPRTGIEGECQIAVDAARFLLLRDDYPDGDSLYYEFYIRDRAGHESNRLETPMIYIMP